MKLILVDIEPALCIVWKEYFKDLPNIEIINDRFQNVQEYDCMVSAANSFGLMDGGVDGAITAFFGDDLMHRVQARILDEYIGEQPVGTSMTVETNHPKHPFLAHTPTMRVPMDISHTDNVYLAMWAMLVAVSNHNKVHDHKIETILCPGHGTGTGNIPYREAARQMALAYKNYIHPLTHINWHDVTERQVQIRMGGYNGFRFPMDEYRRKS